MANSTADNPNNIAIGIDLGTTYSCVGVWQYGVVEIIANSQGNRITPSCVAFTDTEQLVGEAAMNQLAENETNTICNIKRLIGREFADKSVKEDIIHFPFTVKNEGGKFPKISVKYKEKEKLYTPEEISAMILHEMKVTAENYLGHKITDAVITVPAYFNDAQKQATMNAGKIAELNVLRLLQEPTAAAVAFGVKMQSQGQKSVLVFDLGGGTFDVTVMVLENGIFEVKAINGDTHLGGEDFTNRIVDHFVKQIRKKSQNKEDIGKQKGALVQLKTVCEDAKRALSTVTETTITVELSSEDYVGTITRAEFEKICDDLFKKTLEPVKKALADSKLDKSQIDDIILAGGSTRIPKIQRLMKEFFNADNADEEKELNTSIHPDEAIAYGAAIKAAQMTGNYEEQNMLLLDVTPLSLGIQTAGGKMEVLISRNTTIPVQETKKFSTATDNQPTVLVQEYEGERAHVRDNILLGRFPLTDLPTPKSRKPEIDVTFDIDANGILTVSAMETSSGKENKIIFDNKNRHSKEEIQRMKKEAEQNRAEDEQYRQRKDALNNLKILLQHIKDAVSLEKFTSQVNSLDQQKIKNKIIKIENWITNNSNVEREKYQEKREELNREYNAMVGGFRNLDVSPQVGTTRSSTLIIVEDN